MILAIILSFVLQSPRQAETFSGAAMLRAAMAPQAIIAPVSDLATNKFGWTESWSAEGYRLYQYYGSITNVYETTNTQLTIVYSTPDNVPRWFYFVIATNGWGDSDPSNRIHFPPYDPDRQDLFVPGKSSFTLQESADLKTWTSRTVTGKTTVFFSGPRKSFRVQGMTNALQYVAYNPLNE